MQQFVVPQFIDVEDKIIGPITTRQFVILLSGALVIAICYKLFDFSLFVTVGFGILMISGIFAFARVNGRPFHLFLLNLIQTLKKPGLRVWKHNSKWIKLTEEEEIIPEIKALAPANKQHSFSRLAELSLMVDTKGAYGGSEGEKIEKII